MIDAFSLRLGELLLGALSQIERLGGDMQAPEIEESLMLIAEQRVERERFERYNEVQEARWFQEERER